MVTAPIASALPAIASTAALGSSIRQRRARRAPRPLNTSRAPLVLSASSNEGNGHNGNGNGNGNGEPRGQLCFAPPALRGVSFHSLEPSTKHSQLEPDSPGFTATAHAASRRSSLRLRRETARSSAMSVVPHLTLAPRALEPASPPQAPPASRSGSKSTAASRAAPRRPRRPPPRLTGTALGPPRASPRASTSLPATPRCGSRCSSRSAPPAAARRSGSRSTS